jgi:hypothetical protein
MAGPVTLGRGLEYGKSHNTCPGANLGMTTGMGGTGQRFLNNKSLFVLLLVSSSGRGSGQRLQEPLGINKISHMGSAPRPNLVLSVGNWLWYF